MNSVTVIIPTFNRREKLNKAIDSVLNQTYKISKIIITDDGSTDDTEKYVKENYPTFLYIKNPHYGSPAIPINKALEFVKTDYVAFLDSDDLWKKNKIEKQINFTTKENYSITTCLPIIRNQNGKEEYVKFLKNEINFFDLLHLNLVPSTSSILVKTQILKKIQGFPNFINLEPRVNDWVTWSTVTVNEKIGIFVDEELFQYNKDNLDSLSVQSNKTNEEERKDHLFWLEKKLNSIKGVNIKINIFFLLVKMIKINRKYVKSNLVLFNIIRLLLKPLKSYKVNKVSIYE